MTAAVGLAAAVEVVAAAKDSTSRAVLVHDKGGGGIGGPHRGDPGRARRTGGAVTR